MHASEAAVLQAERRSLRTYMVTMLCLAALGFAVYALTRVSATQFDGIISLINAGAAFIASRLAVTSSRPMPTLPTAGSPWRTSTRCSGR